MAVMRSTSHEPATVKSARRALDILNHFDVVRRELTMLEIAKALGYPASSASVLLRTLVALGYLSHDQATRTFRPTARVTLLGSWINTPFFRDGALHRLMNDLSERSGETIVLAGQNNLVAQYISVVEGTGALRLHLPTGATRPLMNSGVGRLFLSRYQDDALRVLARRLNTERAKSEPRIAVEELLYDIHQIRRLGYSVSTDRTSPGAGIVAKFLPCADGEKPLAVGIGGRTERIRSSVAEFSRMIQSAIALHLIEPTTGG
jgi:DNA-binding IclR family transcriptional regulator